MSDLAVHFSSETDEWATPPEFFHRLNLRWRFSLDACASERNAKCASYFTKAEDGLVRPWTGRVWCNPPYGREISKWVQKAALETRLPDQCVAVLLLPARTETGWWWNWVRPFARVTFIRGRLRFIGPRSRSQGAPFPSALAVYPKKARPPKLQLELLP